MYKESINLGPVILKVKNFEEVKELYVDLIGLKVLNEGRTSILLGDSNNKVLEIIENKSLISPAPNSVGLYHIAIVFPTQSRLAKTIKKIFERFPMLFEGSADHLATEAFYFQDQLGNGIELYFDKPREEWPMENGKPAMGSIYIDPDQFIQKYLSEIDNNLPIKLGHIHLKVSDIQKAKEFYVELLGFDVIFNMPTALFVSYDNYHHHFGLNIWESANAPELDPETEGMKGYEITYLDKKLFSEVFLRIEKSDLKFTKNDKEIVLSDPFGIEVTLRV
jgi:catechol 2,3-dioxygenase